MLTVFLFLVNFVSAVCKEGQIYINTASLEELDEIYRIGPVKAQAIIDSRPYETLDDLINVKGIAEKTLSDIKSRGLACVNENEEENNPVDETSQEVEEGEIISSDSDKQDKKGKTPVITSRTVFETIPVGNTTLTTINLTPKNIKSDNNLKLEKNDYAIYGFIAFCILLAFLFIIRKRGYNKNEFN